MTSRFRVTGDVRVPRQCWHMASAWRPRGGPSGLTRCPVVSFVRVLPEDARDSGHAKAYVRSLAACLGRTGRADQWGRYPSHRTWLGERTQQW